MRIQFFTWVFSITMFMIFCVGTVPVHSQCLEDQRTLLLQLKNSLKFNPMIPISAVRLASWTQNNDCCKWEGVTCDQAGHVTGLNLNIERISGGINSSSSLFRLEFLENLNLAYNSFNFTQIPSSFGNLTCLRYLNLSYAGFAGQIPIELSHLTKLVMLDLSTQNLLGFPTLQIENPNLSRLLQNLTGLTELYLDGINISANGNEWGQAISSSLPKLRVLSLFNCQLSGPVDSSLQKLQFLSKVNLGWNNLSAPVTDFLANFPKLTALSLKSSNLYGAFPSNIFQQVPTLETLNLENNKLLNGSLPEFQENGFIQNLVLSNTSFSGTVPDSIGNLTKLSRIEFSRCNFTGPIPKSMAELSHLVYLDLSSNMFTGPIPSFQKSKNLSYIDLSHNALTGPVPPTHFQGLSDLVYIGLAYNSFNGNIPSSLFSLPSLQKIQLSNNKFSEVSGFPNGSLSPLETLDLSSNKLQGPFPSYFFDFRRLIILSLSFNNFSGSIQLESIKWLQNLTRLELSHNSLSVNESISNSSLSSFPQLSTLRLASCNLQKFPPLMNQSRMFLLDLSDNQISGVIPNWIWNVGDGWLMHLNLSCNLLVDLQRGYTIPTLPVLDLHFNRLSGEIPTPPESAIYVDYSSNNFSSSIPAEIGNNLFSAYFFSVSNNRITGAIPHSMCNAIYLQVLDLSNNSFSGTIPQCLIESSMETLGVLNLGKNDLTGHIVGTFPQDCTLKTLDLNGNHLEGQVPESVANCATLEVLNLGNNNMNDNFPCFLKNSSSLRVLVLRSNKFQGGIGCPGVNNTWPNLQIIDLATNNFSGVLSPTYFLHWKAMMGDGSTGKSYLNHLRFDFLKLNDFYYQDTVTVTNKGLEMKLVKILTIYTSIDFSSNNFQGEIPDTVGALKSLYVLNLSNNALTGSIPPSVGNLTQLGSLDLSWNKLNGSIPVQLASLTFLSFLNLSYNQLAGMIPTGSQFQTFSETSFEGNKGLCGPPLNSSCEDGEAPGLSKPTFDNRHSRSDEDEINWVIIISSFGYSTGFGVVVVPLLYWKRWRRCYYKHVDRVIERILGQKGQRGRHQRRREDRNLTRRRQHH